MAKYPHVEFFCSGVYNKILAEYEGKEFGEKDEQEVGLYVRNFQKRWDKINDEVFRAFEKVCATKVKPRPIVCYVVKYLSHPAFSHPLTIRMPKPDREGWWRRYSGVSVIHELCHVILESDLRDKWDAVEEPLKEKFPDESSSAREHFVVNLLEYRLLSELEGEELAKKVKVRDSKRQGSPGSKRAWEIIDQVGLEPEGDVFEAVRNYCLQK